MTAVTALTMDPEVIPWKRNTQSSRTPIARILLCMNKVVITSRPPPNPLQVVHQSAQRLSHEFLMAMEDARANGTLEDACFLAAHKMASDSVQTASPDPLFSLSYARLWAFILEDSSPLSSLASMHFLRAADAIFEGLPSPSDSPEFQRMRYLVGAPSMVAALVITGILPSHVLGPKMMDLFLKPEPESVERASRFVHSLAMMRDKMKQRTPPSLLLSSVNSLLAHFGTKQGAAEFNLPLRTATLAAAAANEFGSF